MEKKILNGKVLHAIGIGTWAMGGARHEDDTGYADYDRDAQEVDAIRYSISKGQNHIDTAQMYGEGHCEEIVGQALVGLNRDDLFIASKVNKTHASRSAVPRATEGMLKRLGINRLDLLYVHGPWDVVPMSEYINGVNDALEAGLTDTIGVSNFDLAQLKRAMAITRHPIVANQVLYNLFERKLATPEFLDFCRENEIMIVAYRPLERKKLADQCSREEITRVAANCGRPVSHIALNWLISQTGVVAIPKASMHEHIDENLAATDFALSAEDMQLLDGLT